ncbi:MAG TPA: hypothetical protein VFP55_00075 [Solirubrobacteraceae bacterium]|nr:hypothetical protein [Solirubrobacteraceae bacterium]
MAELLAALPPAPVGWVEAAVELPTASAAIEEIAVRCLAEEGARQAALADLEQALRRAGVEPHRRLVERLRTRIA